MTIQGNLIGEAAIVSSFGAEAAVLLHLALTAAPRLPVVFIDTGLHFPETLRYGDALLARLGHPTLIEARATEGEIAGRDAEGERHGYDPDGCCELRTTLPRERALAPFDAIITGRKAISRRCAPRSRASSRRGAA